MKCYKFTWKKLPFEDKVDFFSPLCSKYQWEYACNNTQRITLSASQCNKMHTWFWLSFFVVLQTCTEVTMYFVHEDEFSTLTCFKCFFRFFLYVMLIMFTWVEALDVKGLQFVDGPFRVYMSPLTSFFEKRNWEVCFVLILNGQINACRQRSSPFFNQKLTGNPLFFNFCLFYINSFFI